MNDDEKKKKDKGVTIRVPEHIWKRIKDQSDKDGRSLNAEVVQCIIEYLNERGYDLDMVNDYTEYPELKMKKKAKGDSSEVTGNDAENAS